MIGVNDLFVEFGGEKLFSNVSFRLNPGDRVGLAGKNGAGKSTLLRILAKRQEASGGVLAFDKGVRLGFLTQDIDFHFGATVLEEAYKAFEELRKVEARLEEVNEQLGTRTDYESEGYHQLMVDLNDLTHQYELLGGYTFAGEVEKILLGLGFQRTDFDRSTDTFSGGWRMRIELAKLLLQHNDVLLLDEPTNHLDIESILWLEDFLLDFKGAVVIVSHDRMFLDRVTNRTIEISRGRIYDYPKNYTQYLSFREELLEQQRAAQKNQEKQIAHTEKLIEKFRAKANKASMAQSLIKKLDRVERIEVDERESAHMKIRFPLATVPGRVVLRAEAVSKSFGSKNILNGVNLSVERGSKIAFVGQNGQGKTTLAKILVGELKGEGAVTLGHNVNIGYFAQNQAEYLDPQLTVLQTMELAANDSNRSKVRDMLGAFLFQDDEVFKKVKVLSGGERNRLAICKMLLFPFNVLVMDEPTNHLDMDSKTVLKEALLKFDGTLLLVSHDREFLQGLCQTIYEFRERRITEYLGDINFYLEQRNMKSLREAELRTPKEEKTVREASQNGGQDQKAIKLLKNQLGKMEADIAILEKEIGEIEAALQLDYDATIGQAGFFDEYQDKKSRLDILMKEWEVLHEELDKQGEV